MSTAPNRVSVLALLAGGDHDYLRMARPLLRSLESSQHFNIDLATEPDHIAIEHKEVLLVASDHHLRSGQAALITDFARRGGGVVLLHGTLAKWAQGGEMSELAGWAPTGPTPVTELVVHADRSHTLTQRLGPELKFSDELYLSEGPPSDSTVVLRTSWHFTDQVVAYERAVGSGRFVHIGLEIGRAHV